MTMNESEGIKSSGRAGGAAGGKKLLVDDVEAVDAEADRDLARRGYAETELDDSFAASSINLAASLCASLRFSAAISLAFLLSEAAIVAAS